MLVLKRLLREPILHFLVAGTVLYAITAFVRGPELMSPDENTIVVDRQTLLSFLQFRSNAFDSTTFDEVLNSMSEAELNQLIEEYVEEEVLFREASALGLDSSDYVIRRRMVQKMQFLLGDLAVGSESIDEKILTEYFEKNKQAYWVQPTVTFTHVFFDASRHGEEQARLSAQTATQVMNRQQAQFNDVPEEGDRFIFLRNYVGRTLEFVESHFGASFVQQLMQLDTVSNQWQGPVRSAYGYHVVLITEFNPGHFPPLSAVSDRVTQDYLAEREQQALAEMTDAVQERYNVEVKSLK